MNEELEALLLDMLNEDKRVRTELAASGELFDGYAPRMAEVHERNAKALERIIDEHGWPGFSLVGAAGAQAAWIVAQHAIGLPEFQRRCLTLLQKAAARGEAEPAYAAYLDDRICFHERRPQRYGTQFDWDENGRLSPWTLEDPDRVDSYRAAVGLEPLAKRLERVRRRQRAEGERPPRNVAKRREAIESWARSVGWL